jgi:hypothetical protein
MCTQAPPATQRNFGKRVRQRRQRPFALPEPGPGFIIEGMRPEGQRTSAPSVRPEGQDRAEITGISSRAAALGARALDAAKTDATRVVPRRRPGHDYAARLGGQWLA